MKFMARTALAAAMLALSPFAVQAQSAGDEHGTHHASGQAAVVTSDGEVRKVNKEAQKITLRHGELKNLGMPPMTMVFRVADPAFLEQVTAGDKVNFVADKVDGQFTIMQIEAKQ